MPTTLPLSTVIFLTDDLGIEERLDHLLSLLREQSIRVMALQSPDKAKEHLQRSEIGEVQCVVIECNDAIEEGEGSDLYLEHIHAMATDPDVEPILVTRSPSPDTILSAFRHGASDIIDLDDESDDYILDVLHQTAVVHHRRVQRRKRFQNLRLILNDLLKNLIQTERRTIDLEYLLAAREGNPELVEDFVPNRQPTVLVADDDNDIVNLLVDLLEEEGVDAHACSSGQDIVAYARQLTERRKAIDMAVLDIKMPGMTGVEAIRELRNIKPNLTAMLMTGYSDTETAISAVNLGVVAYVTKPFANVRALVQQIKDHAIQSMKEARGRHYLEQIKQRHAKILLRYQRLAADLEQLAI